MHRFCAPSGYIYFYNSDFSGGVRADTEQFYTSTTAEIEIPFEDIRALYLEYLRSRLVTQLERADYDELEAELLK